MKVKNEKTKMKISEITSEKVLERKLVEKLHAAGVWCEKYSNQYKAGYPDRLCIAPGGHTFWVEVKSTGEKLRALQEVRICALRRLGTPVFVVDSMEGIERVVRYAVGGGMCERVYLSAPISGHSPHDVAEQFGRAEEMIRKETHFEPINPLHNGLPHDATWAEHMVRDLRILSTCSRIVLLDGWRESVGCRIEKAFADRIGMFVYLSLEEFIRKESLAL